MSNHYQFAQGLKLLHKVENQAALIESYAAHRSCVVDMRGLIGHAHHLVAEANRLSRMASDLADWLKSVEEEQ